jgi:hypothetical protein
MKPVLLAVLIVSVACRGEQRTAETVRSASTKTATAPPSGLDQVPKSGEHPLWMQPPKEKDAARVDCPTPPRQLRSAEVTLTPEQRKQFLGGVVLLRLTIERDGRISGGRILKGLPMGRSQAAIDAVGKWAFEAGKDVRGLPARCSIDVAVPMPAQ